MTEEFLHYIWKYQLFDKNRLFTDDGEKIKVIKPGEHNKNAGPDFFNSQLIIGDTTWAGNTELHIFSSDWRKHLHHMDKSYDNVILQVVYSNDEEIYRSTGEKIPTAQLIFDEKIYSRYSELVKAKKWIPCQDKIGHIENFTLFFWLEKLLIERLEKKSAVIERVISTTNHDWEEAFYQLLARNFGFNINSIPFELLAKSLPLKYLIKHKNDILQLEALLLGQGGFLEEDGLDDYYKELKREYKVLRQKFSLTPIENHLWKYLRLRPMNFPTIRLAQFASLIHQSSSLFSKILDMENVDELEELFSVQASSYWDTHYTFNKETSIKKKKLGKSAFHVIIINTVVPFLFFYGKLKGDPRVKEKAFKIIEQIPAEKNSIIQKWSQLGLKAMNSCHSQALIHLKSKYCESKKCLHCQIGNRLIAHE